MVKLLADKVDKFSQLFFGNLRLTRYRLIIKILDENFPLKSPVSVFTNCVIHRAGRKVGTIHLKIPLIDKRFVFSVQCMEVRRGMISLKHLNYDAVEDANGRHPCSRFFVSCVIVDHLCRLCCLR